MGFGTAAAAGFKAFGAYQNAQSQQAALDSQAQASEWTAGVKEQQAKEQLQVGNADIQQSGLKYAAMYGSQRAAMAANGVSLDSGSASAVLAGTKLMNSIDASTIRNNTNREAWNYEVAATNARNQAAGDRAGASSISPLESGMTTLLTGGAKAANSMGIKVFGKTPSVTPSVTVNGRGTTP